jgi:hypothetical protein
MNLEILELNPRTTIPQGGQETTNVHGHFTMHHGQKRNLQP